MNLMFKSYPFKAYFNGILYYFSLLFMRSIVYFIYVISLHVIAVHSISLQFLALGRIH